MFIYVLDRGLCLLATLRESLEDKDILDDCSVIRVWGTSEGIGQIAKSGPTSKTVLDHEGDGVEVYHRYIIRRIPCDKSGWTQSALKGQT